MLIEKTDWGEMKTPKSQIYVSDYWKEIEIHFWMNQGLVRFGPQSCEDTKYQRGAVA